MPKLLNILLAWGLAFGVPSSFAQERTGQVGGYAQCTGSMPIMGMMTMMGPTLYKQHAEGCLTFMKTEIKIAELQAPQWNAFVGAIRGNVRAMTEMYESMMLLDDPSTTLPERLSLEEKTMASHLASLRKIERSLGDLYGVLDEDQKRAARRLPLVQWVFQRTK